VDADQQRLEIYKLAVEMAERVSARRATANTFFASLNGVLATIVGVAGWSTLQSSYGLVVTALAGVTLAVTWLMLIRYYRSLNVAKFVVINDIETRLVEQPFKDEWAVLKPEDPPDQVTKRRIRDRWKRKHREATVVEQFVPLVFVALYAALALGLAGWWK
jgi:hypothetical protein